MRIAVTFPTIKAYSPQSRTEAAKAPSDVHTGLHTYLKQSPHDVTLAGPVSNLNAAAGFKLGAPVPLAPGAELLPLVNDLINPDFNPNLANDIAAGACELINSSSAGEGMWRAVELAENLPNLPRAASATVHLFGVVRSVVELQKVKQYGPKNKVEVGFATAEVGAAIFKLLTDCPGLECAQSSAVRFSAAVKIGRKTCLIPLPRHGPTQ
jgi:hypothetical protein